MAKPQRSEDRNYTPEPGFPEADAREQAVPPPGLKPDQVRDEGDPSLTDDLGVGPEEPDPDLNEEQQS